MWDKPTTSSDSITNLKTQPSDSVSYVKFDSNTIVDTDTVTDVYRGWLRRNNIAPQDFSDFISSLLQGNYAQAQHIIWTGFKNGIFQFTLDNWKTITPSIDYMQAFFVSKVLENTRIEYVENKAKTITDAVESIYKENKWVLWNDEIDDKDRVTTDKYWKDLQGKTLMELKSLLDIENKKLLQVYTITWETHKKEILLKQELKFYVGIGDTYEGGARYFSMSNEDIDRKVSHLVDTMSYDELFTYMKQTHKSLDDNIFHGNYKKSDMVQTQNARFLNRMYEYSFNKLKSEDATNREFINLIKVMTGRWEISILKTIKDPDSFDKYEDLDWDPVFRDMQMANTVMIYVMNKKWWIIEALTTDKTNDIDSIELQDDEVGGRSPAQVLNDAEEQLSKFAWTEWSASKKLLQNLWFWNLIWTQKLYKQLTFDEKVSLWAIARITTIAKDTTVEDIQNTADPLGMLQAKLMNTLENSFKDLNDSLGDHFDGLWGLIGKTASDLGLDGDLAEIFDLYQDINGNLLFDLADKAWLNNITWAGTATFALSILAAWVTIWLLAAWSPLLLVFAAWAAAWALAWIVTTVIQKQGYDTTWEGIKAASATIVWDAVLWALFFLSSVKFFRSLSVLSRGKIDNINILNAGMFTWLSFGDMIAFWGSETFANAVVVNPAVSAHVKQQYPENHFNTDHTTYHTEVYKKQE